MSADPEKKAILKVSSCQYPYVKCFPTLCVPYSIILPPLFHTCITSPPPPLPPPPLFLQALSEVESEDLVQEERARKAAVRKSRMESELDAENADLQEKKGVSELILCIHTNISILRVYVSLCTVLLQPLTAGLP